MIVTRFINLTLLLPLMSIGLYIALKFLNITFLPQLPNILNRSFPLFEFIIKVIFIDSWIARSVKWITFVFLIVAIVFVVFVFVLKFRLFDTF